LREGRAEKGEWRKKNGGDGKRERAVWREKGRRERGRRKERKGRQGGEEKGERKGPHCFLDKSNPRVSVSRSGLLLVLCFDLGLN